MATIVTRAGKGSPLTNNEVDANFNNLNTELGTKANTSSLATVATTGAYSDLTGQPTTVSSFTNDSGYITSSALSSYQPLDGDLTAIAALAGTTGFVKKTAANTYTLDTATYLTGITSGQVTTALGFTPYNSTNPAGYITSTASITGTASNVTGTVAIANGGTGAITAPLALAALGAYAASNPSGYTSNVGTVTGVTGTAPIVSSGGAAPAISITAATTLAAGSMSSADKTKLDGIATGATANTGTVTSVGGTGTVSGLTLSGSVTTTGNLTLGGTLAVTAANFASQTANTFLSAPNGTAGVPTFRAIVAADIPTLNQNTTGTASNVTGTVAIANGGTGAITAAAALTALGAYPSANPSGYTSNTGTVTGVTGTAPIVSSGGAAPAISISAATTGAAGSMSAADKTKLDGIAASANNYVLPKATDTALGGVEVFSTVVQTVAANAVSTTASRTYGVQLNAADQMVVNVPWSDANSGGTVTSVGGTGTVSGLTLTGTVTTAGNLTLGGTLSLTSANVTTALGFTPYNATNPSGYITSSGSISGSAGSLSDNTSYMVSRGSVALASVDTALSNGFYTQTNTSDSSAVLVFNAGGSVGPLQQRFTYTGNFEFRNKTDSTTFTAWRTVLTNVNYNTFAPTLTGGGASGTWGISITGSSASTTGNAATATTLQTARTINGVSFNGSANITITAAANGGDAATAGGFTPSATAAVANRVVVADANGYIFNNYFNSTDNSAGSGVTAVMVKAGDNYFRSGTAAAIATFISGQTMNISGSSTSCSGNAATATTSSFTNRVNSPDGDRDAGTKLPTTSVKSVRFDFASAASAGTLGNFAGVMTYAPWLGDTASTGDASYQLAFGGTAVNGGGVPMLNIRKGIDSTWNSWYTIYHTGNFTSSTVTTALGFTPYNATNPAGYTSNTGTVTSVGGTGTVSGLTLSGTVTGSGNLTLGGTLSLTSANVTTALGFTPYNATNPSGYITSSALTGYLTSATAASTYQPLDGDLTAIAALAGTTGLIRKTAANTYSLDTATYLTGITSGQVTTALGFTPYNSTNPSGYISGITSANVTTALGYTPYNSTNPSGYTSNTGTVTSVSVTTANGVSGTVATSTTTPAITITLGAITPTSVVASGDITAFSDRRIKSNIETIPSALDKLDHIRGVTYTRTDLEDKERRYAGVIAQEVEVVLPEAVRDHDGTKAVDYNATIALLIQAVKELRDEVEMLKK